MAYPTASEIAQRVPSVGLPDDRIEELIAEYAEIAESYRGVAFSERERTESFRIPATGVVQLSGWPVREIETVEIDGVEIDPSSIPITGTGMVHTGKPGRDLVVTYSYGMDTPAVVVRACAEYVRAVAQAERSGTSRDVIAQSFDGGFTRYSTPDWGNGRPTGFLEVDRLLNSLPDFRVPGIA
jgi:hypothetical protein